MTKSDMDTILNKYSKRIFAIGYGSSKTLFLNYNADNSPKQENLKTGSDGEFHYLIVPQIDTDFNKKEIQYEILLNLSDIQWVGILKEGSEHLRPNPSKFK